MFSEIQFNSLVCEERVASSYIQELVLPRLKISEIATLKHLPSELLETANAQNYEHIWDMTNNCIFDRSITD